MSIDIQTDGNIRQFAMPKLNPSLPTPLYHQLFFALSEKIKSGEVPTNSKLPAEQCFIQALNISRITVKRAINDLAAAGLVRRQRGSGTVVIYNPAIQPVRGSFENLDELLTDLGLNTEAELIERVALSAPDHIANNLKIEPGSEIEKAIRLRRLENQPFSYIITYVPNDIARNYTDQDLRSQPLLQLLKRAGVKISHAEQTISAISAEPAVANALGVTVGSPLLYIHRTMYDADDRPVQDIFAHYRPEKFQYHMILKDVEGKW